MKVSIGQGSNGGSDGMGRWGARTRRKQLAARLCSKLALWCSLALVGFVLMWAASWIGMKLSKHGLAAQTWTVTFMPTLLLLACFCLVIPPSGLVAAGSAGLCAGGLITAIALVVVLEPVLAVARWSDSSSIGTGSPLTFLWLPAVLGCCVALSPRWSPFESPKLWLVCLISGFLMFAFALLLWLKLSGITKMSFSVAFSPLGTLVLGLTLVCALIANVLGPCTFRALLAVAALALLASSFLTLPLVLDEIIPTTWAWIPALPCALLGLLMFITSAALGVRDTLRLLIASCCPSRPSLSGAGLGPNLSPKSPDASGASVAGHGSGHGNGHGNQGGVGNRERDTNKDRDGDGAKDSLRGPKDG